MDEPTKKKPTVTFERTDDFRATYANNVRFESTVHDLTIIFGKIDQGTGEEVVKQHTSVTLPWSMIKLAQYYLEANMVIHQSNNGKVLVPPSQLPVTPTEPDDIQSNPTSVEVFEKIKKLHEEFIAKL